MQSIEISILRVARFRSCDGLRVRFNGRVFRNFIPKSIPKCRRNIPACEISEEVLGKRIMIFGPSASGKSTVANALGERLNIPVHHLDHFCFLPNTSWRKRPWEEFQKLHRQVVESDEWIIDGNYPSMMQCRMARATAVVWLNPSAVACIFNFYKRFFRKHRSQTPYAGMLEGANEKFTLNGVRYILKHKGKKSFFLKLIESFPHVKVFYLNSFKKIENFPRQISTEP